MLRCARISHHRSRLLLRLLLRKSLLPIFLCLVVEQLLLLRQRPERAADDDRMSRLLAGIHQFLEVSDRPGVESHVRIRRKRRRFH